MFITKTINKKIVAVSEGDEISVRKHGRAEFGNELSVCRLQKNDDNSAKLVINVEALKNFGIKVCFTEKGKLADDPNVVTFAEKIIEHLNPTDDMENEILSMVENIKDEMKGE